ncbi:hypothetical protein KDW_15770 [Dictyobacter vulcani]|uniref:Heme-binding protein n=1 Tax=Dictyobacter vulcani TaxID=2607529 RepID=A0A5J4KI62_9CHLR|nr:heme-binding protein [Dictyobacter vulcani]GER87415.1 hypothetical protein KDW_15770 [Dictyobacter vulcani]
MSISIEMARKVLEVSKQRALELRSPVSIAIVDAGGHLVLFERMMAPYGFATGNISIAKAHTAVMFNQPTDDVAQWGAAIPGFASSLAAMTNGQFIMAAGGWPLRVNGVTIGGIGISGGNAPGRDDEIARAGIGALEAMAPAVKATPPVAPQPQPVAYKPAEPSAPYSQPLYSQPAYYNNQGYSNHGVNVPGSAAQDREKNSNANFSQEKPADHFSQTKTSTNQQDPYNSFRSQSPNPPNVDHPGDQA